MPKVSNISCSPEKLPSEKKSPEKRPNEKIDSQMLDKKIQNIGLISLYRYANYIDYILLTIAILLSLTQGSLNSMNSLIFKGLTDTLIQGETDQKRGIFDYEKFYNGAMAAIQKYALFGLGIFFISFISMSCWHTICERQVHQIRKRYFKAILKQNMGWFDENESGEITNKLTDGIDRIRNGIGDKMGLAITYTANFIGGITVAFTCSWKMTLVVFACIPIIGGSIGFLSKFISDCVRKEMAAYGKASAAAEEVISSIRTVISLNGQEKEIERYDQRLKESASHGVRKALFTALAIAFLFCIIFVTMGIAFWFGTKLFVNGEISAGTVFATFWAVLGSAFSLGAVSSQIPVIVTAINSASSVFSVIDRVPEIDCTDPEGKRVEDIKCEIEFKDVHFAYPSRTETKIFDGLSFKILSGQSAAFVGHSGSGKSTIVSLLFRFYDIEKGQITIDGVPLKDFNLRWLRENVGVVSQEPVLFAATVEENLRLGNENITDEEMIRICRLANAHEFIEKLPQKYKTTIGEGGIQLSGGQKQRIAIARVLTKNPKILLLDEATSALDTESEQLVQQALDNAKMGRTTIVIAHRLSTIRNCDSIIVLDHGEIIEQGTHRELMNLNETYSRLVKAQEIEKLTGDFSAKELEDEFMLSKQSSISSRSSFKMSVRLSRTMSGFSNTEQKIREGKDNMVEQNVERASFKQIIMSARKEWKLFIIAIIASFLRGLTFPIFSLVYGSMFKSLSKPSDQEKMDGAVLNAIYFAILGICVACVAFNGCYFFTIAGELYSKRLRLRLFKNIVKQDGEYFDSLHHSSGKLVTCLATDPSNVRSAIDQRTSDATQSLTGILYGIIIAFSYGPKMAPIGIATAGALVIVQSLLSEILKRKTQSNSTLSLEPARLAMEAIESHRTVQYLSKEEYFCQKFGQQMELPHKKKILLSFLQAVIFSINVSFIYFNFASTYRFGVWLIKTGNSTPYIVFQVIESLNLAFIGLLSIGIYMNEYVKGRVSLDLIFNLLSEKPKIDSFSTGGKQPEIKGNIRMDNLYFAYPANRKSTVIKGISADFIKGRTVALVGASGCGKSTVIQLIQRFYDPIDGHIACDGHNIKELKLSHFRSHIGVVSQEPALFNYTIWENITYGLVGIKQNQVEEAAKIANAHNFIMELPEGYDTVVGEKGNLLSVGQKQRIAIARAIIRNPEILLLDEATSALDSQNEKEVQEALDRARQGRTCIVVAHRLSSIQNSDLILVVKDGRIIEEGNHQQLLSENGLYTKLIEKQSLE